MQNCALLNPILGELMQMNFDNSSSITKNALTNQIHAGREWTHIGEHFPYIYSLPSSRKHLLDHWSDIYVLIWGDPLVTLTQFHTFLGILTLLHCDWRIITCRREEEKKPIPVHENKVQHISASAWIEISNDISGGLFVQPCQVSSSS